MPKTIVVLGGSGFLGRKICETGAILGHKLISLSRSGKPSSFNAAAPWCSNIEWRKFDIFENISNDSASGSPAAVSSEISEIFSGADAVVHTMGILFEPGLLPYKQFLSSPFFFCGNANRKTISTNVSHHQTYEEMNRDSALKLAALAFQYPSIKTFVFVSACHDVAPIIPRRYISTKIEAEKAISSLDRFRTLIFRPGMMTSTERPVTTIASSIFSVFRLLPVVPSFSPSWSQVEPISASLVAAAIINSINTSGPVPSTEVFEVEDIKKTIYY